MKIILPILLILCASASAQTALDLFNPAAREYIVGNTAAASNLVTQALNQYPSDKKLQQLKELIDRQQNQQQNQEQQDQNQDQQNQDQSEQDQSEQDLNQQGQKDQQGDQKQQDSEKKDSDEQDPQEAQPSQAQPLKAGQMTQEEAQQLLDAMKQNEKDERTDLRPILGRPVRVDKDW